MFSYIHKVIHKVFKMLLSKGKTIGNLTDMIRTGGILDLIYFVKSFQALFFGAKRVDKPRENFVV